MARGSFDPEIRQSINSPTPRTSVPQRRPGGTAPKQASPADSPAEMAADKARGIKQGSPEDEAMDAKMGGGPPRPPPMMPSGGGGGGNPAHAAIAASIAHAILGRGGQ